ncbi:hypothetical protein NMY22_g6883 [Coprinellus aureogranulatus]|nr:hypothetical protein NMY22_g6883 [Coprinellus aureogranulatus]
MYHLSPSEILLIQQLSTQLTQSADLREEEDDLDVIGLDNDDQLEDLIDEPSTASQGALNAVLQQSNVLVLLAQLVAEKRNVPIHRTRGPYNQDFIKSFEYFDFSLQWPDREFRHEYRMSRDTFDKFVTTLEKNTIFTSRGRKPQRAVRYQLAAFLMRYGSRASDALSVAKRVGIGVGTVWLYCRRVTRALRELGLTVITWGDEARRTETEQHVSERTGGKFSECIGMLDGSLIRLAEIPSEWGTRYFCRKKYPAVNIQAVCDHQRRFISCEMGWPGSAADVTILKNSHLWLHRGRYFSGDQYLLADRGYQSSPYLVRPFTEPEVDEFEGAERRRRLAFNKTLSGTRIYIEHTFGLFKARFPSLKDFGRHSEIREIFQVIQALMVLHNMCIDWDDTPATFLTQEDIEEMQGDANEEDVEVISHGEELYGDGQMEYAGYETEDWHREEGRKKRNTILNQHFPVTNY